MSDKKAYRELLRVFSIIAGSSIFSTLMALLRNKAAAMLLGPSGVGLIGLLQSLMTWGGTLAAMGLGTVGARAVADSNAHHADGRASSTYKMLKLALAILGTLGAAAFLVFQGPISRLVLGNGEFDTTVGWLGLGVLCTAMAGAHSAYLRGMRRVGDQAKVTAFSAAISTALAIGAVYIFGNDGVVAFVVLGPVANFMFASWYASKVGSAGTMDAPSLALRSEWSKVWRAGLAFMITGVVVAGSHLALRAIVRSELGIAQLGLFQASWMITIAYIGFVVTAMSNDYYPRISEIISKNGNLAHAINQQTDLILLVATPLLLAMQSLAPVVLWVLYTDEFMAAENVLRWQLFGDTLKIVSWPLGMVALAAGDSKTYMRNESSVSLVFLALGWASIHVIGLVGVGISYFIMYALYFPLVYWQVRRRYAFGYTRSVLRGLYLLLSSSALVFGLCVVSPFTGATIGVILSFVFAVRGIGLIWRQSHFGGVLGYVGRTCDRVISRMGM